MSLNAHSTRFTRVRTMLTAEETKALEKGRTKFEAKVKRKDETEEIEGEEAPIK